MYENQIKITTYLGPAGQAEAVKNLLQAHNIPDYSAHVYEQNRDTGYAGLAVNSTYVDLRLSDDELAEKVDKVLISMRFSQI